MIAWRILIQTAPIFPRQTKNVPMRNKLTHAIVTAISATAAAAPVVAQIEEVIVTATKREASTQDIPVSVQALQGDSLNELRVGTFQDYVQFLPNVTTSGTGPGTNEIFIRGAATEQSILSVSTVQGTSPAVALYLDEQPVSFGGRNLDVYATDLERIEVLPGPQGTLFGASSQAGTVRLITNKPVIDEFQAGFKSSISSIRGGGMNNSVEGYLNVPVSDNVAIRIAAYNDHQAGWIDNILNDPTNGGYTPSIAVLNRNDISAAPVNPATPFAAADNTTFVENDFNDATYTGGRFGARWYITDEWSALIQHTEQSLDTEGVFSYDPNLAGTSSTNRFAPDQNEDDFGLTTWTFNGRLAMLDVVYTGGYLDRSVETSIDYTGYTNGGGYQVYYMCAGSRGFGGTPAAAVALDGACFAPEKGYAEETDSWRMTHEIRFNTPQENRARVTTGFFYDDQKTETVGAFVLAAISDVDGSGNLLPGTGAWPPLGRIGSATEGANAAGRLFGPKVSFINDYTRKTEQIAIFGNVEFDVLENVTATFGARWYDIDIDIKGFSNFSFGCKFGVAGCSATSGNDVTTRLQALGDGSAAVLDARFGAATGAAILADINAGTLDVGGLDNDGVLNASDVVFRASLDWKVNDDIMLFTTFSQGFRPPTTNRNAAQAARNPSGLATFAAYRVPPVADTDKLDNYEIGLKGDFFENTLRFNATGYYSEISDLQMSRFDPSNVAFLVFIENVGDAEIFGVDGDFIWVPAANLTIAGSFSFIDTEITKLNAQLDGVSVPVGSELPFSPDFAGSLRGRYDFELPFMGGVGAYISSAISYTGESKAGIVGSAFFVEDTTNLVYGTGSGLEIASEGGNFIGGGGTTFPSGRYVQQDYVLVNMAVGVEKDGWLGEFFIDNLTDRNAQLSIDSLSFTPKVVTNRPRSFGFRLSYDF